MSSASVIFRRCFASRASVAFGSASASACSSTSSSSSSSRFRSSCYDIVIVGGGIVGSSLALALASNRLLRGLKICLLESSSLTNISSPLPAIPSLRTSSFTPASFSFFSSLNILSALKALRFRPYDEMQVWTTASPWGRIHWKAAEILHEKRMYRDSKKRRREAYRNGSVDGAPSREEFSSGDLLAEAEAADSSAVLGYIIENDIIQQVLLHKINQLCQQSDCGLDLISNTKVEHIDRCGGADFGGASHWPVLHLSCGSRVCTRLLIGADGPNSVVKRFSSIRSFGWDYLQKAVVASVRHSSSHSTAWQRFLPSGPVAVLPCHAAYSNIVWSTTHAHAKYLCEMDGDKFVAQLNHALRAPSAQFLNGADGFLDGCNSGPLKELRPILLPTPLNAAPPPVIEVCGPRMFFPLRFQHHDRYVDNNIVLVGDAAHVVHPMAGQGVNLGIGDVEELVEHIEKAVVSGMDLGESQQTLKEWQQSRYAKNCAMMTSIDAIGKLFSAQSGPLAWMRTIGLDIFNSTAILKNYTAHFAMGLDRYQ